ncbi:MAG TPA: hypothetical protein VE338_08625, partial [Ktedonobacterales bacterium]|nr:hypothetical protein [Ktedonobacterales bacterium]
MRSLGKVLERLHTAWDHLDSAQGAMRFWYQPTRTRQAWERWQHASPPGSIERIEPSGARAGASPQWAVTANGREPYSEQYYRFWMAKPWRWRVEEYAAAGQKPSPDPGKVMVIDGGMWWSWSTGNAVYTNARTAHAEQISHIGVDRALLVMLDPAPLMGTLRMRVAGSAEAIDRQGDVIICTARDPQPDPGLWPGADEYRLLVEREHGILLLAEALLAGEVYAGTAFTDLLLDQA